MSEQKNPYFEGVDRSCTMHLWDHTCPRCKRQSLTIATMMEKPTGEVGDINNISIYCFKADCEFDWVIAMDKMYGNVKRFNKNIKVVEEK